MHCKHAQNLLFDHLDGALDTDLAEAVDSHLADCHDCRAAADDIAAMAQLASGWQDQEVPAWPLPEVAPATATGTPVSAPQQPPARVLALPGRTSQWLPLAASLVLAVLVLFQVQVTRTSNGLTIAFGGSAAPTVDTQGLEQRLTNSLAGALDSRLAQLETNQQLLLTDRLDALDTEQSAEQRLLARAVLSASQQQNRSDIQALLAVMDARLSRQEQLTRQGLAVLLAEQARDRDRLDDLDQSVTSAVRQIADRPRSQL